MKMLLIASLLIMCTGKAGAQDVVVKSNLLYLATATPNLAMEFATGGRQSLVLQGGWQPWEYSDTKKLKHWLVQPEYRWWTCETFNGHFFGLHALGGQFNAGGLKLPFGAFPELEDHRYQGWAAGGGLSWGYHWMLGRKWGLELTLGLGYLYIDYKKYPCPGCGSAEKDANRHYVGPTKAAINLVYVLK
ncbi:MAG: DUF3575 domain-containing protein [Bacteroides sp.]|nr:DUF3575 domain-containing protein [Bacteroides sp.]